MLVGRYEANSLVGGEIGKCNAGVSDFMGAFDLVESFRNLFSDAAA